MEKDKPLFEDILAIVGEIGFMQWIIILFSIAQDTSVTLSIYFLVFAETKAPSWTCGSGQLWGNGTALSEPFNDTDVCPKDICLNITYNVIYTTIVTEWDLICDKKHFGKMTVSLLLMGMGIGTLVAGQLADLFGRRKVLLASWTVVMLFHTCLGFMPNYPLYVTCRILGALGIGGCAAVGGVLPAEYVGSKWRVFVSLKMGWRVGAFMIIGLAYAIRDWRHLAFASGAFFLPLIPVAYFLMPESARWSIQRGRFDEAIYWLKIIARFNKKPCPDVALLKKIAAAQHEEDQKGRRYTYLDLFRGQKYALRTIFIIVSWFSLSLMEYSLVTMTSSLSGDVYTNMALMTTFNLIVRSSAMLVLNVKWIGRKRGFVLYTSFAVVCTFTIMVLDLVGYSIYNKKVKTWLVIATFGGMSGSWSAVFMLAQELYPTLTRSLISSTGSLAVRIGGVLAPQVVLLGDYHPSITFIIIGCCNVFSIILIFIFIPETQRMPLPEDLPPRKIDRENADTLLGKSHSADQRL